MRYYSFFPSDFTLIEPVYRFSCGVTIITPLIDHFNPLQLYYIFIYSPIVYQVLGHCPLVNLSWRNARSHGKLEFQMHSGALGGILNGYC